MGVARTMGSAPATIGVACALAALALPACSLVPLDELQDGAVSGSGLDGLVARLDADGNAVWATALTGAGDQRATATALDATGAVLVGGGCVDAVDFGQGPLGCATGDLVVLKLAP